MKCLCVCVCVCVLQVLKECCQYLTHTLCCRNFIQQLRKISNDAGMPFRRDPAYMRYQIGMESVEPIFRQLCADIPGLQLIMVVLPGKTPVYGEPSNKYLIFVTHCDCEKLLESVACLLDLTRL